MFIGNCNVTAELVSLIVAGFLTFLMLYSNPRKTSSYQIIHYGILLSMISIATQLAFFYSQAHTQISDYVLPFVIRDIFGNEYGQFEKNKEKFWGLFYFYKEKIMEDIDAMKVDLSL